MTATAELAHNAVPSNRPAREPVAVFLSRFPSVTETFILREITELERQGQPVRLVPMLKETPKVVHEAARAWTPRALYTKYVSPSILAANAATLLRHPLRYLWLLVRLIAGTIAKPGTLARTLLVFPKSVFIARQLQRENIKHIHAHFATYPTTMALIVAKLTDITFSFTVHAHDIQVDRSLLRWKLRETRFVRSISDFNKRFLEELYPKEARGKISVVHVGIEPEKYEENSRRARVESEVPHILCVAAHRPYKGLPFLIEACRILKSEGIRFECHVLGDGPMRAELEALAASTGVADVFHLLGPRPENVVADMMRDTTIFVLPSIIASDGQMEGIPVALMEAMASARAVVTTSIAGIPELVDHDASGLLVPPSDARALAEAMKTLLRDPERAAAMGRHGQKKVRAEFTLTGCVAQLGELLRRESHS